MSERVWFKWILVAFYMFGAFSLPCLLCSEAATQTQHRGPEEEKGNTAAQGDAARRPVPSRDAGDQSKTDPQKSKECSGGLVCRVIWPRVIHLADVSTYDPVAFFTLVLAVSTIGLWWVTRQTLRHAQEDSDRQAKNSVDARRAWLEIMRADRAGETMFDGPFVEFPISIFVRNVGASPALNVWIDAEVIYSGQFAARREEFYRKGRERAGNIGHIVVFPGSEAEQGINLKVPTSLSEGAIPPPMVFVGAFYKYPGDDAIHESTATLAIAKIPRNKASDSAQCLRLLPTMVPLIAT